MLYWHVIHLIKKRPAMEILLVLNIVQDVQIIKCI